jgi:hypothetical protein
MPERFAKSVAAGVAFAGVAAAVVLDQPLARLVERAAARRLSDALGGPVKLRISGARFLPQAVRGRYRAIDVSGSGLRIGDVDGVELHATLRGIHVSPSALLRRRAVQLACAGASGEVRIPYAELARLTRIPTLVFGYFDEQLVASVALPIPGLNQFTRVTGGALIVIDDGGSLRLRLRGLAVAGFSVPPVVLQQLLKQLLPNPDVPIALPQLPHGLRLDRLTPTPAGLVVGCRAHDLVLRPQDLPDVRDDLATR